MENSNNNSNNNTEGFHYTYSAKEQAELKKIREKYSPKEPSSEDKMERLRRLDNGVTQKAQMVSLILGVIGTLALGVGMSLTMSDFRHIFGVREEVSMIIGIITGILGIALVCLAYPTYNFVLKRERRKIAPEIIRLTDELMK